MTYRSADLTAELHAMPDTNPPPSTLDLDLVRSRGSALRRRRRTTGFGTGLAIVGLTTALILALVPHPTRVQETPSPPARASQSPTHDPLSTTVAFGWLPAGLHLSGGSPDDIVASNGSTEIDVVALKPGLKPPTQCSTQVDNSAGSNSSSGDQPQCDTAAPDVNGRTAYWDLAPGSIYAHSDGYVQLDWQYAPNTWAYLLANIGSDTSNDIVATVYKVAENARFGAAEAVPLPFHLPSVPAGMHSVFTVMWQEEPSAGRGFQPRDNWIGADLTYGKLYSPGSPPSSLDFDTGPAASAFPSTDELEPGGTAAPAKDVRHLTVDGHQAVEIDEVQDSTPLLVLVVHDVGGVDFTLSASGTLGIKAMEDAGGIVAYYESIKVLGANPSDWTTDVVG